MIDSITVKSEIPASILFILSEIDFFFFNSDRAILLDIINYALGVEL